MISSPFKYTAVAAVGALLLATAAPASACPDAKAAKADAERQASIAPTPVKQPLYRVASAGGTDIAKAAPGPVKTVQTRQSAAAVKVASQGI